MESPAVDRRHWKRTILCDRRRSRTMIARLWSAVGTDDSRTGSRLRRALEEESVAIFRKVDGYVNAMLLKREVAETVEIIVITWWHWLDAVRQFAGDDFEEAVVADEARAILTAFDVGVRHYELALRDVPSVHGL